MGKPDAYTFDKFSGLDLRSGAETTPPSAAIVATNAILSTGGDYVARPPLRKVADLDPRSSSLYVAGDTLRSAVPWTPQQVPADIFGLLTYDLLRSTRTLAAVAAGATPSVADSTTWKGKPYLTVKLNTNDYEHHYLPASHTAVSVQLTNGAATATGLPAPKKPTGYCVRFSGVGPAFDSTYLCGAANSLTTTWTGATGTYTAVIYDPADTGVSLPFVPGPSVTTAAEKVWAPDLYENNVWFSSTEFGPTNWTALDDAGFLPTATHIDGDQPILGLGTYRGQLLVLARRALQLWNIDPDPTKHALAGTVGGSGCDFPRTFANVGGDAVMFATGQFRTLSAVITTGQPKDGDIGAKIAALTRWLVPGDTDLIGVWWPNMQLYLGFYGARGFAYTNSPESQLTGWTTWELPFPVSHAVYWNSKVWVRRLDKPELWVFDPESQDYSHEAEAGVPFIGTVQWAWNTIDGTRRAKLARQIIVPQEGASSLRLWYSPRDPSSFDDFYEIDGSTTGLGRVMIQAISDIFSPQFTFEGYWRLGEITIYYERGNLL